MSGCTESAGASACGGGYSVGSASSATFVGTGDEFSSVEDISSREKLAEDSWRSHNPNVYQWGSGRTVPLMSEVRWDTDPHAAPAPSSLLA